MELIKYGAILLVLLLLELLYFRLADRFNIIDKPNQRSSHSRIVLRGGGIIFTIALWLWSIMYGCPYPWLLAGVTLAAGVSFIDDIHSLPDSIRLVVQFVAMFLVFQEIGFLSVESVEFSVESQFIKWIVWGAFVLFALIVAVAGTNIYLIAAAIIMAGAYIVFMCKYYHLHEDYLRSFSLTKEKKEPKETATPQTP